MTINSLPQNPALDPLESQAACVAADIHLKATWTQRHAIEDYGRCLIRGAKPTPGLTLRFWRVLHALAPRLPDYTRLVACHTYDPAAISRLQDAIARRVARGEDSW